MEGSTETDDKRGTSPNTYLIILFILFFRHLDSLRLFLWISFQDVDELQKVYQNVKDIDLLVGAISENHDQDSIVGPTFQCIIGK